MFRQSEPYRRQTGMPVLLQILRRQRIFLIFSLPEDRHNPPTLSIIHQLHAVDPTREWLGVSGRMLRIVGAENVSYLPKLVRNAGNLPLIKPFLFEKRTIALNVVVDGKDA